MISRISDRIKIFCRNRENFGVIQKYFLDKGYVWAGTGKGMWFPSINWETGVVIEFDRYDSILYFNGNISKYNITDEKFIIDNNLMSSSKRKIIKYVDNLFETVGV